MTAACKRLISPALLMVFSCSVAEAAETVGVLLVAPPGPVDTALVAATGLVRQAVAARQLGVLEAEALRERMRGASPTASLSELDRAYDGSVKGALAAGDWDGAVHDLNAILEGLEELPPSEERHLQWTRAALRLAKVQADLGHAEASQALMDQLVRRAPEARVDAAEFPARFVTQLEVTRKAVEALPKQRLVVESNAPGTRIYLDGRSVGEAPQNLRLPVGQYAVVGRAGASLTPAQQVTLAAGGIVVRLDFSVPNSLRPDEGPGLALPDAGVAKGILAAGGYLGLDKVVVVGMVDEAGTRHVSGSLYDVRRGIVARQGRVRLGGQALSPAQARALAEFLLTGSGGAGLVEDPAAEGRVDTAHKLETPPDLSPPAIAPARPLATALSTGAPAVVRPSTSAMGWLALAAGVGAVGLGAYSAVQVSASNSDYKAATSQASAALLSKGDDERSRAKVTGAAGAALGVTAVVLVVVSRELGPIHF